MFSVEQTEPDLAYAVYPVTYPGRPQCDFYTRNI